MLSFFVAERLVTSFPNMTSEHLTDAQQLLVNNRTLAAVAKGFGIHDVMRWSPVRAAPQRTRMHVLVRC